MAFFDKQTFLGGISGPVVGGTAGGIGNEGLATTAAMTIDVNVATGNDTTGDGTAAKPFATIMRAVNAIPHVVRHPCTIRVFSGTYAETLKDSHMYMDTGTFSGGRITIQGQDFTTPTLGSGGITSGTLGTAPASPSLARTVAGAVWTPGELKGYLARITSGSLTGRYYPIADNAAGTIDIPDLSSSLNGATFDIVNGSCVITRDTVAGAFASAIIGNAGPSNSNNGLIIQRIRFNTGNFYGCYVGTGCAQLLECQVEGHTFAGAFAANHSSQLVVSRSYIKNTGGVTAGVVINEAFEVFVGGTVIDGGPRGIQATSVLRFAPVLTGTLVIQNTTSIAMEFRSGPTISDSFSSGRVLLRNNAIGLQLQSNARFLAQFWDIINNTSHGIQIIPNQYLTGFNSLNMFSCKIQGNGGDAIRVETPHNHIMFGGSGADISGNTGYGLRFGGTPANYPPASHNSAFFDPSVTMSSNTAGDITHDNGVTTKTITQVRADVFEAETTNLFNRVGAT